jgi:NAD-dependent dihydropyrimidine dehydrogenase PreA subunit
VPIDRTFRETWKTIAHHEGHPVWESTTDETTEIHGMIVGVDMSLCYGCEKCITACPRDVFTYWPDRDAVDPIHEANCIFCLVCEIVCPVDAINIKSEGGSQDTLKSLLQDIQ